MTWNIIIASINVKDDQYITYKYTDDIICQYVVPHIVYKLLDHRLCSVAQGICIQLLESV